MKHRIVLATMLLLFVSGCSEDSNSDDSNSFEDSNFGEYTDSDADSDTDSDTDADADADGDADSDADSDADANCQAFCVAKSQCRQQNGRSQPEFACPSDAPICCEFSTVNGYTDFDSNSGTGSDSDTDTDSDIDTDGDADQDGDGVDGSEDPNDNDASVCGDSDKDGCDDCSVLGQQDPDNDGWDVDGNGQCELSLSYDCMNGVNAADDPWRREACVMFTYINMDRAKYARESGNAAPLAWSEEIWEVAAGHAMDMCERNFFDHYNPDDDGPTDRAKNAGLSYGLGENIALNYSVGAAQYAYMNEPTCKGHRANVLNKTYIEVGVAYLICDNPDASLTGEYHISVQNYRSDWTLHFSEYCCRYSPNACQVPPNPPSTAYCDPQTDRWGFCPPPDKSMLSKWGC